MAAKKTPNRTTSPKKSPNEDSPKLHVKYKVPEGFDPTVYQSFYESPIALLNSSKQGLEAKAALDFIHLSGLSSARFQDIFKTTVKTIQNYYAGDLRLDAALSEKLLKSFSLFENGITVFGSVEEFQSWLNVPAYGLGDQIPFELMDTITGINLIEEELTRIAYGDLA